MRPTWGTYEDLEAEKVPVILVLVTYLVQNQIFVRYPKRVAAASRRK